MTVTVEFARFSSKEDRIVRKIAARAVGKYQNIGAPRTALDVRMDISAVHYHTPLRLADLLAADDFNFFHDIDGINRHIDRETGLLRQHFRPRFAMPASSKGGE